MIIARLSYPKMLAGLAFTILLAAFPWWAILTGSKDHNGMKLSHDGVTWVLLFLSPGMILASLALIWRLPSRDSHSIRISDGLLSYSGDGQRSLADRFRLFSREGFSAFRGDDCIRSILLTDITAFSIGPLDPSGRGELVNTAFFLAALFSHTAPVQGGGGGKGIFAQLKGGQATYIPTNGMDAPRDVILARLNQALAESRH